VAVSDLYGRIGDRVLVADEHPPTADDAVEWAVDGIRTLLADHADAKVVGVGVSVAAPVQRETGVIRAGYGEVEGDTRWADWQLTRLREHINDRLRWRKRPVLLDNDANLNALAEYIWGAGRQSLEDLPPYQNIVYLEWSWGIGMGLIIGGELYRGGGIAGEIGHTVVRGSVEAAAPAAKDPDPCLRCNKQGCLEAVAGLRAILKQLPAAPPGPQLSRQHFLDAVAAAGTPDHAAVFDAAATRIDRVLGPVIQLLNPELVIIGGDIGRFGYDAVRGPLMRRLKDFTTGAALADVVVVGAKLRKQPTLQGAVSLLLRPTPGDPDELLAFLQRTA
jgi:predicted NBD/HSP70 family sugar kinase